MKCLIFRSRLVWCQSLYLGIEIPQGLVAPIFHKISQNLVLLCFFRENCWSEKQQILGRAKNHFRSLTVTDPSSSPHSNTEMLGKIKHLLSHFEKFDTVAGMCG